MYILTRKKSRDYINCSTGTRSEASEGPTSITKIQKLSVCLFVCLFVRGVHFDTQKSRDYINCSTGTRSEASERPTSACLSHRDLKGPRLDMYIYIYR